MPVIRAAPASALPMPSTSSRSKDYEAALPPPWGQAKALHASPSGQWHVANEGLTNQTCFSCTGRFSGTAPDNCTRFPRNVALPFTHCLDEAGYEAPNKLEASLQRVERQVHPPSALRTIARHCRLHFLQSGTPTSFQQRVTKRTNTLSLPPMSERESSQPCFLVRKGSHILRVTSRGTLRT